MPCYRVCLYHTPPRDYNGMAGMRALWENWDLRILILYILLTQLYLHFSGRMRRKSASAFIIVIVWLLYLFSDLFATIALGKLSKLKVNNDAKESLKQLDATFNWKSGTYNFPLPTPSSNVIMGKDALRVMWAPLILFYLGGPDTITVLRFEENKLWTRHLLGLVTQALRTAYALIATLFMRGSISYLALLLCIPGIIKYGERVWVVMSNSNDDYTGLLQLDPDAKIDKSIASQRDAERALQAHSWFLTLRPHAEHYECHPQKVKDLVTEFRKEVRTGDDAFKLMEIELGLIYDMLFSKVSTIFTKWGSILRFISFSFLISVLVVFVTTLTRDKLPDHFEGDDVITIILLVGAIFLDLAGIAVQLKSDWALVWACNNRIKWGATPVLFLHENLISDRQTWSGFMGQLSLREFCKNYKCNKTWESLFGKEKLLKRFSSQKKPNQHLKDLIFRSLCEISDKHAPSGVRRAEWILVRDDLAQQFKWSNEIEFSQCIVIWHVATEVCYWSDPGNVDTKVRTVKMLSDYMMYLLVAYSSIFPFCNIHDGGEKKNICDEIMENHNLIKELFNGGESLSYGQKGAEKKDNTIDTTVLKKAHRLVQGMKENRNRWDIMGGVWVETLRHAAWESPVQQHIEELRRGGEFFTHVWLLLMHLGDSEKLGRSNSSRVDEHDSTPEDSKDNNVAQNKKEWDLTRFWGKTCGKISPA